MTPLKNRREQLLRRLGELDSRLHKIEDSLDSPHSQDWEEAAVEREGEEVLEGLGNAGQEEIRRIRAALQRMREDEYGACVRCGEDIAEERLDLLPDTPFCASCAANH
ncbi:TraR/DksA family transcriptional regulator [Thalassovita mediterranea]|jgi:RNA polymerase-binding transcription factor DksA|uniref:Regulatory protein, yteA family n=1 Tax=Thalassovita mediterranea TaxID=340021 RepID=A0A0P1GMQ1_9RHOB|nr:TraR/DksA C4-type zinc finger protein [Thalassovita mediterranea]MCG7574355.1 TraR/DksA C4-type zinc finger protein [Phaeobacter sp. CNT1-3]CUH83762.1 regulatory protein, yteA family [Thalassovita mediterranea]SIS28502.1 transcriptional regulator, TraR/DksA family [Thalassovita mediterranea]